MTKTEKQAARITERAVLEALVRRPPPEHQQWGVVRTRLWERAIKKARPYLKRNARLATLLRERAAIEAVSSAPLDGIFEGD